MRTLLLDTKFGANTGEWFAFTSMVSAFDYDIVIWDPVGTSDTFEGPYRSAYRGRPAPTEAESVVLLEALTRRRQEFIEFLRLGRSVVVIASPPQTIWVDTGTKEKSGTGRNQKVTRIVKDIDLMSAIPRKLSAVAGRGLELHPASTAAASLWKETEGHWIYRCILEEFPGARLLEIPGTGKVVGSVEVTADGGVLALLPEPWVPSEDDENDEFDEEDVNGDPAADGSDASVVDVPASIVAWAVQMGAHLTDPAPDWAATFRFESEIERQHELTQLERSVAKLAVKIDELKQAQAEDDLWKRLSFSSGAALEEQTCRAFEVLGFKVLEAERGRSDLRLEYDQGRVVVEVKGLSKSAAEKNAAQLEKWVAEETAEGVPAKGVLVVNTWREVAPDQRPIDFPAQMIPYSTARGHCLITSLQLLTLARRVSAGKTDAPSAAREILSTVGPFNGEIDSLRREPTAVAH